jgi:CRISPR/Cas system-associated protein Cas10 (large subunit of type III CRISPR-Cas system)
VERMHPMMDAINKVMEMELEYKTSRNVVCFPTHKYSCGPIG